MPPASRPLIEQLAATMHESYRCMAAKNGWAVRPEVDKPYAELSEEYQSANVDGALRIPEVLGVLGLKLAPVSEVEDGDQVAGQEELLKLIEENIEPLAVAEHEGWLRQREGAGWTFAKTRDDVKKQHPSLVPYDQLPEVEREKDRERVRSYPELIEEAGMVALKQRGSPKRK